MRRVSTSICAALLLGAFPAAAQSVSALYQSVRDAGASPSDASGLIAAMSPAIQEARINASDSAEGDNFGISVSLDGDRALVGAWLDDINGQPDTGSAYIFVRTGGTWTQEAKLVAIGAESTDRFGNSVSLSGNRALVGAVGAGILVQSPGHPPVRVQQGAAYVFVRRGDTWIQESTFIPFPYAGYVRFGESVSLDGDRALVGAFADPAPSGAFRGAAYVYVLAGGQWTQEAKLTATDGGWFGSSVSLSGDRALVGAPYDDHDGQDDSGSAFVYVRDGSTWIQEARLTASDAAASDQFGASVSLDSARALVGVPFDDHAGGIDSGSAYVFARASNVWVQEAKLTASDAAANHAFGITVSLSGDRAAVGPERDGANAQNGIRSAYVFAREGDTWTQEAKLTASDATVFGGFGRSVSLDGDRVLVGAPLSSPSGSVYVFTDLGSVAAEPDVSSAVTLSAPYPNPASQRATLTLTLDRSQHVRASVVDALGREVQLLLDAEATGGVRLDVNTAALAPGAYVVRVMGEAFAETRRLTITR